MAGFFIEARSFSILTTYQQFPCYGVSTIYLILFCFPHESLRYKKKQKIQVPKDEMYLGLRFKNKTKHVVQNYHIV